MSLPPPHAEPIKAFERWLAAATKALGEEEATAMCLATATKEGIPSARMVLLKAVDARGFVFYTNHTSRKGEELLQNPQAALCFHWEVLKRQVRIEGKVERIAAEESDAYFNARPRASRIGAWASKQSSPLKSRQVLVKEAAQMATQFGTGEVPRPPHWGGFRIKPLAIEFWEAGTFRIHNRRRFSRSTAEKAWHAERLYP